jgi:hypothetical protein
MLYFQKALSTLRDVISADLEAETHAMVHPPCSCRHHDSSLRLQATREVGDFASFPAIVETAFEFYDKVFMVTLGDCCCERQVEKTKNMLLAAISKFLFAFVAFLNCLSSNQLTCFPPHLHYSLQSGQCQPKNGNQIWQFSAFCQGYAIL